MQWERERVFQAVMRFAATTFIECGILSARLRGSFTFLHFLFEPQFVWQAKLFYRHVTRLVATGNLTTKPETCHCKQQFMTTPGTNFVVPLQGVANKYLYRLTHLYVSKFSHICCQNQQKTVNLFVLCSWPRNLFSRESEILIN